MAFHMSFLSAPLKVEDYCSEFTPDLPLPSLDFTPDQEHATEIDHLRRSSVSSLGTIPSPVSPVFPQSSQDDFEDCWNLIPYNVPWGHNYHNYEYGTLPGPEGACIFLRSPTPVKSQRTSQACKKCRERKAKVRLFTNLPSRSPISSLLTPASRIQCSGTRPSCERCLARGHSCVYVDDPKRVRHSASNTSLGRQSHHPQSRSFSRRTSSQSIAAESPLDDARCSSPCSPVIGGLSLELDSEADFSAAIKLNHEDPYDGEFPSIIQLPETPYMLSIQSASLDQSTSTPSGSVISPQPMRYPQLGSLLSVSIPGSDEIPALESTSSSPASSSSQPTPLLGYQSGMYDPSFVTGEFGYDQYALLLLSHDFVHL